MKTEADFLVIGAGMAGASVAAHLAQSGRVVVVEAETQPAYHTTGRSAALFAELYGNPLIRALTRASRPFLFSPPLGFSDLALVQPRASLHQGFLRQLRARGGKLCLGQRIESVHHTQGLWHLRTGDQNGSQGSPGSGAEFTAPVVVNAAGAWADDVARLAGVQPQGLAPLRRTALLIDTPAGFDSRAWPAAIDVEETFYFRPEAGALLLSPADETPSPPCDAQADELDVAVAVDRFERATGRRVARVRSRWAGLRVFAPDRSPVVGFDAQVPGFFWLGGQGGYGIQTAPALARAAAALVAGLELPSDLVEGGVRADALSPNGWARAAASQAGRAQN